MEVSSAMLEAIVKDIERRNRRSNRLRGLWQMLLGLVMTLVGILMLAMIL